MTRTPEPLVFAPPLRPLEPFIGLRTSGGEGNPRLKIPVPVNRVQSCPEATQRQIVLCGICYSSSSRGFTRPRVIFHAYNSYGFIIQIVKENEGNNEQDSR